jgi:hypothetical protein
MQAPRVLTHFIRLRCVVLVCYACSSACKLLHGAWSLSTCCSHSGMSTETVGQNHLDCAQQRLQQQLAIPRSDSATARGGSSWGWAGAQADAACGAFWYSCARLESRG